MVHLCIFFFFSLLTQCYFSFRQCYILCNSCFKHSYHVVLHPGNIEAICQKLIDNFFKQSPAMQESVAMRLQALKVALYSTNFSSREKASDCHTRLVLQAINALFRCLLRPKNITSQDKVGRA